MSIQDYLDLPYTVILKKDDDGVFIASIKELKGCVAHGSTQEEALKELRSMQELWIESCLADGCSVPDPEVEIDLPSGKWLQRVPRSLHGALVELAEREGVSLNQLVVAVLSKEVGAREASSKGATPEVVDPWKGLIDTPHHAQWTVIDDPSSTVGQGYVRVLLASLPKSNKREPIGIEKHGKETSHERWN